MNKKPVTMKDIALKAGVSVTTVSHVISKTRNVAQETRELVLRTLDELDYQQSDSRQGDPAALDRERAVLTEQAQASGKPPAVIEKMVEGRIRKYYEEVVLLEQVWVHDGESRVKAVVKKAGAELKGFARFKLGDGIEKATGDFAAEVKAAAGVA